MLPSAINIFVNKSIFYKICHYFLWFRGYLMFFLLGVFFPSRNKQPDTVSFTQEMYIHPNLTTFFIFICFPTTESYLEHSCLPGRYFSYS